MTRPAMPAAMQAHPEQLVRARRLGQFAARRNLPVTSCPYDPSPGAHPAHRAMARAFVGSYLTARPPLLGHVDYSGDVDEDGDVAGDTDHDGR